MKIIRFPYPDNQLSNMTSYKLPKFSGLSEGSLSPENFLSTFLSFLAVQKFDTDSQKIAAFHLHLDGDALSWFHNLSGDRKDTWSKLQSAFKSRFQELNSRNAPDMVSALQNFNAMTLQESQSISDFYGNISEKARALKKSPEETMLRFIDGLPEQLKYFVRLGNPSNIDEAVTAARNAEAYGYRYSPNCASIEPSTDSASQSPQSLSAKIDRLTNIVERQQTMLENLQWQQQQGQRWGQQQQQQQQQQRRFNAPFHAHTQHRPRFQNTNQRHFAPVSNTSVTSQNATFCSNCNLHDHNISQCNKVAHARPRPDLHCFRCKLWGHSSRFCTLQENY